MLTVIHSFTLKVSIIPVTSTFYSFTVPSPVTVIVNPEGFTFLAGTSLQLSCVIQLHESVNTAVAIIVEWVKNDTPLDDNIRTTIVPPVITDPYQYEAQLLFSTLSTSVDTGTYSCISTIYPTFGQTYTVNGTGRSLYSFSVTGKY